MKRRKRVGLATKIFVAVFSVYAAVTLISLQMQIKEREVENSQYTIQLERQALINEELNNIVNNQEGTEDYIAKIARDSLDYIYPGEKIFVDTSSK